LHGLGRSGCGLLNQRRRSASDNFEGDTNDEKYRTGDGRALCERSPYSPRNNVRRSPQMKSLSAKRRYSDKN